MQSRQIVQKRYRAIGDVVHRPYNLDGARGLHPRQYLALFADRVYRLANIFVRNGLDKLGVARGSRRSIDWISDRFDGGRNLPEQLGEVAKFDPVTRPFDRATARMTDNDNELCSCDLARELDRKSVV